MSWISLPLVVLSGLLTLTPPEGGRHHVTDGWIHSVHIPHICIRPEKSVKFLYEQNDGNCMMNCFKKKHFIALWRDIVRKKKRKHTGWIKAERALRDVCRILTLTLQQLLWELLTFKQQLLAGKQCRQSKTPQALTNTTRHSHESLQTSGKAYRAWHHS